MIHIQIRINFRYKVPNDIELILDKYFGDYTNLKIERDRNRCMFVVEYSHRRISNFLDKIIQGYETEDISKISTEYVP